MARKRAVRGPAKKPGPRGTAKGAVGKNPEPVPTPKRRSRLAMVRRLIAKWAAQLETEPNKSGIAEFVRLLSLEKEMTETREEVKEIKVTWVEPKAVESLKSE